MLSSFLKNRWYKSASQEGDEYLAYLQVGSNEELATTLYFAFVARDFMLNEASSIGFPEDELSGTRLLSPSDKSQMLLLANKIVRLKEALRSRGGSTDRMIASGLVVWLFSVRAIAEPRLFSNGRRIWTELLRGKHKLPEAVIEFVDGTPPEQLIREIYWVPAQLAPRDDGPEF